MSILTRKGRSRGANRGKEQEMFLDDKQESPNPQQKDPDGFTQQEWDDLARQTRDWSKQDQLPLGAEFRHVTQWG